MTRVCLALVLAVSVAACGGSSTSPSSSASVNVAFSTTDLTVGTGATASAGRIVSVNYTGWLYDSSKTDSKGTQFDSSVGRGAFSFVLGAGQVIAGWDLGVATMKVGEKTKFKLLRAFKSPLKVKEASLEELSVVAGKSVAEKLIQYRANPDPLLLRDGIPAER